jgi:putative endonuclease
MAKHNKIGEQGEEIAAAFLLKKGYIILHRNWRAGRKEVDIIAEKDGIVVITEIKTRTSLNFAFPEEAVNRKKQRLLKAAAEAFMLENPECRNVRYDIISIVMTETEIKEIMHFEEAFN